MFNNHSSFEKLSKEALIHIASFLDVGSLLQLALVAKAFRHLMTDELVFRQLTKRDYGLTEKLDSQTWVEVYKQQRRLQQQSSSLEESETSILDLTETRPAEVEQVTVEDQFTFQEEVIIETRVEEQVYVAPVVAQQETIENVVETEQNSTQIDVPTIDQTPVEEEHTAIEQHTTTPAATNGECPHLAQIHDTTNEIKRIIYRNEKQSLCDICFSKSATHLNMNDVCHTEACQTCLEQPVEDDEHFGVQLELATGNLYCFKCNNAPILLDNLEKAQQIMEFLKTPESEHDLDKRRKAEHLLYVQELRREDMSLKHYLVEKNWGRSWMLFRTREGSPLPGKISNIRLARQNGTLDPNIRLPMDKFRPSPETHGDIVSEKLWSYLVKAYGVQGRAYSEDDIIAPEYARLRVYVDDYKKSIHLYP